MSFLQQLERILSTMDQSFLPNELAYLAATSKVEGPVRDRLAYLLYKDTSPELFVHREWHDPKKNGWLDIAITNEQNKPLLLLEIKAHSGPTFEEGYSEKIQKDLQKLCKAAEKDTELYFLFLFNHLYHPEELNSKYKHIIKYFDLQNFAAKREWYSDDVSSKTKEHWEKHLNKLKFSDVQCCFNFNMKAGFYENMPMSIYAHLLGPLYGAELEKIPIIPKNI